MMVLSAVISCATPVRRLLASGKYGAAVVAVRVTCRLTFSLFGAFDVATVTMVPSYLENSSVCVTASEGRSANSPRQETFDVCLLVTFRRCRSLRSHILI